MAAAREIRARETNQPGDDDAVELAKRHLVQPWPYAGSVGAEARALIGEGDGIYITDA
ncbi:MAG: aspartate aminotransferase family protein, partial [Mesorhizobium sp.]